MPPKANTRKKKSRSTTPQSVPAASSSKQDAPHWSTVALRLGVTVAAIILAVAILVHGPAMATALGAVLAPAQKLLPKG